MIKWIKVIAVACFTGCLIIAAACGKKEPPGPKTLAEYDTTGKSPQEIAQFVFTNYECGGCHTLSDGKFGYTERGQQIRNQSEGCVSLLTSMNVIAQVKESDRTPEHKKKAAHFEEYGCAMCHKITPGAMGLTEAGAKLESLHLGCVEVEKILNERREAKSN